MNAQIVCLAVALMADSPAAEIPTVYQPSFRFEAAIRGQSPGTQYEEVPNGGIPYGASPQPTYALPATPAWPFAPFRNQMGANPYASPPGFAAPGGRVAFGANGPQPFRFGWTFRGNVGFIPGERTSAGGDLEIFETNLEFRHTKPMPNGWILSMAPQFGLRTWAGPSGVGLPGSVYRIGGDIILETPANSPLSFRLGFNPSLNTDFDSGPTEDAWNWDGRGMFFIRTSPAWTWVLGAGFWDRVDDQWIPYAGIIFNPNDVWEFRLLFPEAQISYFIGNPMGVAHWLYISGEYHIEAYQIREELTNRREQIELEDWRLMIGLRSDNGWMTGFAEAGWVLDRDVKFRNGTAPFSIGDGFLFRLGLRY